MKFRNFIGDISQNRGYVKSKPLISNDLKERFDNCFRGWHRDRKGHMPQWAHTCEGQTASEDGNAPAVFADGEDPGSFPSGPIDLTSGFEFDQVDFKDL